MNVTLLTHTPDPMKLIYTAARTCYSPLTPEHIWSQDISEEKMFALVNDILESGHHSVLEHVSFTFAISGMSRIRSQQLTRHRLMSVSQQSQRYVFVKENFEYYIPRGLRYQSIYSELMSNLQAAYKELNDSGLDKDEARMVLPNATATNLVITVNLRELIHICNVRLCKRASGEFQDLVAMMRKLVVKVIPQMAKYLVPVCVTAGYCSESQDRTCGMMPLKSDVLQFYKEYKQMKGMQ